MQNETAAVLKKIQGLTVRESDNLLNYFQEMITYGHDLQVRVKWHEIGDIGKDAHINH